MSWLKISHHKHTGRLKPHEHTSYGPLALLVLLVGVSLTISSAPITSEASPGPEAGSVGLSGTVPAKPPTVAATIDQPSGGQHFSFSPITIAGTCPGKTLVEIYKNDIFAGSVLCEDDGTYNFKVDLLYGQNILLAKVYDSLNQAGPDSQPVTVFYDVLPPETTPLSLFDFTERQLLLNTDSVYRGTFPGQLLNMPVSILGGNPPYAVNVDWGDGKDSTIPRGDNQTFNASHTYQKAGTYKINLQATDSQERVAFLTVAAIINGQPGNGSGAGANGAASTNSDGGSNLTPVIWSTFSGLIVFVFSFWLGEMREKRILLKATASH